MPAPARAPAVERTPPSRAVSAASSTAPARVEPRRRTGAGAARRPPGRRTPRSSASSSRSAPSPTPRPRARRARASRSSVSRPTPKSPRRSAGNRIRVRIGPVRLARRGRGGAGQGQGGRAQRRAADAVNVDHDRAVFIGWVDLAMLAVIALVGDRRRGARPDLRGAVAARLGRGLVRRRSGSGPCSRRTCPSARQGRP